MITKYRSLFDKNLNYGTMTAINDLKGKLIVFEGLDGSGKTTQSKLLFDALKKDGHSVELFAFPYRTTAIGQLLDQYLSSSTMVDSTTSPAKKMDKHAVHLMFSANRWEMSDTIRKLLNDNVTVILDRYNISGLAYSIANKLDRIWCESTDIGLPLADVIIYIDIDTKICDERIVGDREIYELSNFQCKVAKAYQEIKLDYEHNWITIDGRYSIEDIHNMIYEQLCRLDDR
jgi:dTMP kinase